MATSFSFRPCQRLRSTIPKNTISNNTPSVFASARERDEETTYLVRLEDPSLRLGWMLRRLEEGGSVIVETRARTFEGARRILLGMISSPRADAWLSAHRVCWLAPHGGEWTLQR